MFSTNIPSTLYERLDRLAKATNTPKSVHLEAALRAYLRGKRIAGGSK
jgi:predicted transcriptional regulator